MSGEVCPHCGYDLKLNDEVAIGAWLIDPRRGVYYNQKFLTDRFSWRIILSTLAREPNRIFTSDALLNRFSSSEHRVTLSTQISFLRKFLAERNIPDPIGSRRGRGESGYFWKEGKKDER